MRVLVLGAGVVGVASAWYLRAAGHEVTVVDRQPNAGLETSFANGGQISVCHAEPWANPKAPLQVLRWLGRRDAPLRWHWRADPDQWRWALAFLRECTPARTARNVADIVSLALYSRAELQALRQSQGEALRYDARQQGILHIYTDPVVHAAALPRAAQMRQLGCERIPVDARGCLGIEPALVASQIPLVGGTYTAEDESGDAHRFTQALAARAAAAGVAFRYGWVVSRLAGERGRVVAVEGKAADGEKVRLSADAVVVALASDSAPLLRPLGLRIPVLPAKGYSATYDLPADLPGVPTVSLTDDGHKLVFSRLGSRLRVAGTAEFAGFDRHLDPVRCAALHDRACALFPALKPFVPEYWCGLRPATPSNVPLIGRPQGWQNLWLNTGHGTLGWTMACGSGRALADLVDARRPEPVFPFLGLGELFPCAAHC